jgi:hypothetical protein
MTDQPTPETPPRRRTRTWLGPGLGLAAIAIAVSLFVLPTHAARWILTGAIEDLGLEVRGVETVQVDLWGRQVLLGPVEIADPNSDAPPARVERIGVILSYQALFDRRGLTQDAVIEGIALDISRDADGRITINGVDVFDLLQPAEAAQTPSADAGEAESANPWGAGLDAFELRNSRVTFSDAQGGEAVMQVDRLRLEGFRSWDPQTPGRFALDATINDMALGIDGQATPFADRIDFAAETEVEAVSLDKIERFTGPLPLAEGAGTLSASLNQEGSLSPDGTIAVRTGGSLDLDALGIGLPDGPRVGFERVTVELDTEKTVGPDGAASVSGTIGVSGARAQLTLASDPEAALEAAELRFERLDLQADPQQRLSGDLDLTLTASGGRGSAGEAGLGFARLELSAGLRNAAFDPAGTVEGAAELSLSLTEPRLDGSTAVSARSLTLSIADATVSQAETGLRLRGTGEAEVDSLSARIGTAAGEINAGLDRLGLTAQTLELDLSDSAGLEAWRLAYSLEAGAMTAEAPGANGWQTAADGLSVAGGRIDSALRADLGTVTLERPEVTAAAGARLQAERIDLRQAVLSASESGTVGSVSLSGLTGSFKASETGTGELTLDRLAAERLSLPGLQTGGSALIDGLTLSGLSASTDLASGGPASIRLDRLSAEEVRRGDTGTLGAARIALETGDATLGAAGGDGWRAAFESLTLSGLSAEPDAGSVSFQETVLSGVSARHGGGESFSLDLNRVTLARGEAEAAPALRLTEIGVAGLSVSATSALLDALPAEDKTGEAAPASDPPPVWIGRLSLEDPATIALTDTRHSPPVVLNTTVERLAVRDFDSSDPNVRPQIEFEAVLNDFSRVTVNGWAQPLGQRPNFDLTINLTDLALPTFSPYAAQHLGLNLETGRLSAQADGEVVDGALDAITRLDIRDLGFTALSAEDRERLSATAGMPVETAVGLLQDSEGRIELEIPVQGDLDDPQFELDQVINKAVGSAIAGAAKTTLQIVFPPALLISAVELASSATPGIELAPAPFEPGTAELAEQGETVIDSLGELLRQRPKLTVTVCGRATAADLPAVLSDAVADEIARREDAYAEARTAYEAKIAPLIEEGVLAEDGTPLTETPLPDLPEAPAEPQTDPQAVAAELAETGGDALRDRMTALAAERTRAARLDLAEDQGVAPAQVAECRPVYDPEDEGPPRLNIDF